MVSMPYHLFVQYVTVRLVAEIKLENQIVVPTMHVQVLWLSPVGKFSNELYFWLANTLFYIILLWMGFEEMGELGSHFKLAEMYIREAIVRGRFELRLTMLQHAAFKHMFPYRPRVLMEQLMQRITKTPSDRRFHILQLNKIGQ